MHAACMACGLMLPYLCYLPALYLFDMKYSDTTVYSSRPASKAKRELHVAREPAGELSANESDSAGDDKPARDIKLRPRKRVSFNLDEHSPAEEASEVRA